jgi:hypothetical protein
LPEPHREYTDVSPDEFGKDDLLEASVMRIHYVERYLYSIEGKAVLFGHFEHMQMDVRVFVSGEADIPYLASFCA